MGGARVSRWRERIDRSRDAPLVRQVDVRLVPAGGLRLDRLPRPVENIYPFSKMPEGYVHGVAKFYATAMPTRGTAVPLVAKSNDGRPTKLEGNPAPSR